LDRDDGGGTWRRQCRAGANERRRDNDHREHQGTAHIFKMPRGLAARTQAHFPRPKQLNE